MAREGSTDTPLGIGPYAASLEGETTMPDLRTPLYSKGALPEATIFSMSGEPATLVGCGPSLDDYCFSEADSFILAINESVLQCPEWATGIVWDPAPAVRIGKICKEEGRPYPFMLAEWELWGGNKTEGCEWMRDRGMWYYRKESPRPGTCAVALAILADAGFKTVKLVGFDAYKAWLPRRLEAGSEDVPPSKADDPAVGLSKAVHGVCERTGGHDAARGSRDHYDRINAGLYKVAEDMGVALI